MAENMTPAEETKEVVSKNFIEQEKIWRSRL